METFIWKPLTSADIKPKITALNTRVEFVNGSVQIQSNASKPKEVWQLTFGGDKDTMVAMDEFFRNHKSGQVFYWTPPKPFDVQGQYFFANDDFSPSAKYGVSSDGTGFSIQGFTVEISLRKKI